MSRRTGIERRPSPDRSSPDRRSVRKLAASTAVKEQIGQDMFARQMHECPTILVNGEPARCVIQVQLDRDIPQTYHPYDIQMLVPTEFATLLEIGLPVSITLEQNDS